MHPVKRLLYATVSSYKAKNTLPFEHIFARLGSVTVSVVALYNIEDIEIKKPIVRGIYNIRTGVGRTDDTGWRLRPRA